jgi:NAD(P)-dependent dehydrogenase (short-subunit alcohol dehydrogenase family)
MDTGDRTSIVPDAYSGIGFAIAEAFLALGYNVVGNARTAQRPEDAAARLIDGSRLIAVAGAISFARTVRRLGPCERCGSRCTLPADGGSTADAW